MALIATINGKQVHSDKQMAGLNGNRVVFTDGSWCDVSTGKMLNAGPGYISIGPYDSPGSPEQETKGPERVQASAIEVRGVAADVDIVVHGERYVEFVIKGPENRIKDIRTNVHGGTLVIVDDNPPAGDRIIMQTGRGGRGGMFRNISSGGNIVITGSSTVVTSGAAENEVTIEIKVPVGTSVNSHHVLGTVNVGDVRAPLAVATQAHKVYAGQVTDVELTVQGSGDIRVAHVDGDAIITVQGSGDVEVSRGVIRSLVATVQGSGDVNVDTSVTNANLTVQGSGDIRVAHVQQRPMQRIQGSGDIKVRRIG